MDVSLNHSQFSRLNIANRKVAETLAFSNEDSEDSGRSVQDLSLVVKQSLSRDLMGNPTAEYIVQVGTMKKARFERMTIDLSYD